MQTNIRPTLPSAYATASALLLAISITTPSAAQTLLPEDYLVQMVCVDANYGAIFRDPAVCTINGPKLRLGEALPYHKIDTGGYQISDSFPVASADGSTKGAQTYFFTEDLNKDPLFPDQPFQYQPHGGYNILGADSDWAYFRGTSDPGRYWSPWWAAGCQTKGWRLFPNNATAFSYGANTHGVTTSPICRSSVPTNNATLEWTLYPNYNFIVSTTDPTKHRSLDTLG